MYRTGVAWFLVVCACDWIGKSKHEKIWSISVEINKFTKCFELNCAYIFILKH